MVHLPDAGRPKRRRKRTVAWQTFLQTIAYLALFALAKRYLGVDLPDR